MTIRKEAQTYWLKTLQLCMQLYHAIAGHFSDNVASSLVMAHGCQGEIRWIRGMIPDKSLMECMVASSIFCVLEAAKEMRGICFSIVARCVLITNYSICSRNLFMKEPACTWEQKWTLNWLQLAGRVNFSVRKVLTEQISEDSDDVPKLEIMLILTEDIDCFISWS
jgi:hypothetical protein